MWFQCSGCRKIKNTCDEKKKNILNKCQPTFLACNYLSCHYL